MAALHAGINVVCDKPLALDVRQAREMVQGARDAGVRHLVPFVWRFLPAAAYVKELVDSGFVGTPYHINAQYLNLAGATSTARCAGITTGRKPAAERWGILVRTPLT